MNISAIPRIKSIVLTGLDFSMKPELARFESSKGYIKPFPEIKVMHMIKSLAIMIYNQQKLAPYLHGNVCDGKNSLAYFICAVHRQSAPQPMTKSHTRQNSAASENSDSDKSTTSQTSCKLDNPGENCELPKLCNTSMLPLGYWDSLYYALVADIRQLHNDLQNRFGFACEIKNPTLHQQGTDGTSDQPITALDLASMLETAWYALMDNRLVATLDDAVRMRNLREKAAQKEVDNAVKQFISNIKKSESGNSPAEDEEAVLWPPPIVEGLIDVNALTPEAIVSLLWEKHAPEINRACLENFEDETLLTAYRAELHAREVELAVEASTPLPSATSCRCHHTCVCSSLKCDNDTDECTCLSGRARIYHLVHHQESKKQVVHSHYVKADEKIPNQFLGAATNTLAQMQIAAIANPSPVIVQACQKIHEANNGRELHVANKLRQRSSTNNSDLAYVPVTTNAQNRGPKDIYPLNFYECHSPQRYPRIHPQPPTEQPAQQAPFPDTSMSHTKFPARKPVPPPIITNGNPHEPRNIPPQCQYMIPTPPPSSLYNNQTFTQAGQVTYPSIPVSKSDSMFTQSFPITNTGNPCMANHDPFANAKAMHAAYNDAAEGYIGLLPRHPSTVEHNGNDKEPFPRLSRPAIVSPPRHAATTNALPTLKTFNSTEQKSVPSLSQPDFIAPRPAIKQRYVSAGGNAKLAERPEIVAPAFVTPMAPSGGKISKEEVDSKMSDPEWIRRNFGDAAVSAFTGGTSLTPPRRSDESAKTNSQRNSGRMSSDSERNKSAEKRDRTSSSASGRVAKLKRVFSRKDSQGEIE